MLDGGKRADRILVWSLRFAGCLVASVVVLIALFLVSESTPALREIGFVRFMRDDGWFPNSEPGRFGLVPMIAATLASTAGAVLLAVPGGVLSAVFCQFYAPRALVTPYRRVVELLAGIPSVVYGFWGLVTLVPILARWRPPGQNLLAGILILALMILPTISLLSFAALEAVPRAHLQGAAALGLSRWTTIRGVVLPAARSGLLIAILLGTMRAIGETMAVLIVCGNVTQVPDSLFDPVRTLTANIALEMSYATAEHRSVLFVSGLALMVIIVGLVAAQERLKRSSDLA